MDGRTNLTRLLAASRPAVVTPPPLAGPGLVCAEQAVFTSVPGPLGRGYRLVGASGGITADEKREIVQCGPSHGSLCDPGPNAVGLASFPLASGRRCLFFACHAGREQTARGGMRVHTHVLVLNSADDRGLGCDPLRVEAAARAALGRHWDPYVQRPPTHIEPLGIPADAGALPPPSPLTDERDVERLLAILAAVLAERELLVVGAPDPRALVHHVLHATPLYRRARLSLSLGFRFSPARRFNLMLAEASAAEAQRVAQEHELPVVQWSELAAAGSAHAAWLGLVRQAWRTGRSVSALATRLTEACTPAMLNQIADLQRDLERVPTADATVLQELASRHMIGPWGSSNPVLVELRAAFEGALAARRAALAPA